MNELRPYQREQLAAVHREWAAGHRSTLVVAATGTGKTTLFAAVLAERSNEGPALVLAERVQLVRQTAARIERETGLKVQVEMGDYRADVRPGHIADVVIATVQTVSSDRRLERFERGHFRTVVIDEAHHSAAARYRKVVDYFAEAKVLGVTATPDRSDGIGLGEVFQSVAAQYDVSQAIADGWLVPITGQRVECGALDVSKCKVVGGDLQGSEVEQAVLVDAALHQLASGIARYAADRQTLVFMPGADSTRAMSRVLGGYVGVERVGYILGDTPQDERDALLTRYADGDLRYLVNCMVLTEGFDAPATSAVACCRPTKSRSVYAQQVGRGLRLSPGKSDCLVLDFVGVSGRHRLACPADVLAGKEIPAEVAQYLTGVGPVWEDVAQAVAKHATAEEEAAKAKRRADEAARAARRARVVANITHTAFPFSAFDSMGVSVAASDASDGRGYDAPSAAQLGALEKFGIRGEGLSRRGASKLIAAAIERTRAGKCSYKQAAVLVRYGYDPDVSRADATKIIDGLAANGWRKVG